ncbi:hypothetical protein K1719_043076 [Acacia pycnantha]|nr:hypothetical protein K1719_043017 [Acacia pycnantha]KAI9075026.1 hypothetical protein K1719_043076 [Acacia pycnantha]
MDVDRVVYRRRASRITIFAQLFGILALILLLIWLLHYREGIEYDSYNGYRVFNVHPLLMFMGYIFMSGQAIMAYHTIPTERSTQKFMHMLLHLIAFVLGIVGLCAVFKFHNMLHLENVFSLHSWIGIGTFSLYGVQWIVGFLTFMGRAPEGTKMRVAPWHVAGGRALLYMGICAALTGIMEKYTFLRLNTILRYGEGSLMNFMGLSILLFGVFVDLSVSLAHYV